MYIEYNPNPCGRRVGDCAVRAVAKALNEVLAVMDELMTTLSVVNPRLYDGVMRKL